MLLPHKLRQERSIEPGDTLRLPDKQDRLLGIHYRAFLPPNQLVAIEAIKVVATKDNYPFQAGLPDISLYNQIPSRQAKLVALWRWLSAMPRSQWSEANLTVHIRRSPE